ncbi:amidohydrolase [Texcoconibacillus texcoconensis]|uniref:Amidohydrolase 3 domain-containing protein n=1 Tax=Texcoconibacillus texcoconensis TaxID=1095777 RepID=A0A840QMZ6_9BACI|nr:amidohydrolase [Texcoconibacillus texcoconensis]MBB5172755.1 hypothetical protein [Texcoconibacillus texcoconensis]
MGTLWYGGKIRTMESPEALKEAVFVEEGIIVSVGDESELREKYQDHIDTEQPLQGATMFPGFIDSHLHMMGHGEKLLRLDLSMISSAEEMKEVLRKKVVTAGEDEWIIGEGWNENLFPDRKMIKREELDEIAPHHPLVLSRVCRHALIANSKALDIAKVDEACEDPSGGRIERDEKGQLNGLFHDQAQSLIREAMPEVSNHHLNRALSSALNDLYAHGFVGGHTEDLNHYGDGVQMLETFLQTIDGKTKKFRTNLLVHHEVLDQLIEAGFSLGKQTEFISTGAMKIFADGALGGRTALLSEPYSDANDTQGLAIYDGDELKALVSRAREQQLPVAIHTIGDEALDRSIAALEEHPPTQGVRDRLIHLQVVREDLLERLKKLSVILDIQPRFVASDFPWVIDRLGRERLPYAFAWKRLLSAGLICAGGSDAPIEPIDPRLGIHAAITRRKPNESHEGYLPEEKLTRFEAVRLFTGGSAMAVSEESLQGKIAPGYRADFTIFDVDLFDIKEDDILTAQVVKTVVDNTIMYELDR